MKRYDVRTSVCPSMGPQQHTRCCFFLLWVYGGQEIPIDCCTAGA